VKPERIELWITGTATPLFCAEAGTLGIEVVENTDQKLGMMD